MRGPPRFTRYFRRASSIKQKDQDEFTDQPSPKRIGNLEENLKICINNHWGIWDIISIKHDKTIKKEQSEDKKKLWNIKSMISHMRNVVESLHNKSKECTGHVENEV